MYVPNEYKCANCDEHEDTENSWQIYCGYYKSYFDKTETCQHHSRIKRSEDSENCYITTIVCSLMEEKDKCSVLETLRDFRKNVMQKDPKYKDILYEYDTVGPQIAKNLEENQEYDLANGLLGFYIIPTVYLIREKCYNKS